MKITDQFPTYEQCLKLRHMGMSQQTAFVYVQISDEDEDKQTIVANDEFAYESSSLNPIAAPSVAELGAILSACYRQLPMRTMVFNGGGWNKIDPKSLVLPLDRVEARFRAQLLIDGLATTMLAIEEVNKILDKD